MVAMLIVICGVLVVGIIEQWQYVGTERYWISCIAGAVFGLVWLITRSKALFVAAVGVAMLAVVAFGGVDDMQGKDRVLMGGFAAGLFVVLAAPTVRQMARRYLMRRRD